MLSFETLFLLFEQIITNIEYDHSIHPILGGTPIIIKRKMLQTVSVHGGSQWNSFPGFTLSKATSPVTLAVNYLTGIFHRF